MVMFMIIIIIMVIIANKPQITPKNTNTSFSTNFSLYGSNNKHMYYDYGYSYFCNPKLWLCL